MAAPKQGLHILLLVLICSYSADAADKPKTTTAPCLPDQASSLLQLKRSFVGSNNLFFSSATNNLSSWRPGTDCCHWTGITCDRALGRVISLDLGEFDLMSRRLDPALFNLTSLRNLSLAFNDFGNAHLPAYGFERLTDIIHLNLSNAKFFGQIPIGIARLMNLVTLDFSYNEGLYFGEPSFQSFMANKSNLRELYLDSLDLSSNGSTWSSVLAQSAPQLQVLSLSGCGISGPIHPSFSRLRSLVEIHIGQNQGLTGKVPEYICELSSLSILDISHTSFEGQFPTKNFQLKKLRTLDLSENPMLSVRLTYFPDGNNLQTLNLEGTNFSCDTLLSFANLKSLKTLSLTTASMTKQLCTSIKLLSLNELELWGSDLEKPLLSWVSNMKQLTQLKLVFYDFSRSVPYWLGNLTSLESLVMWSCKFSVPVPYQIGTLAKLTSLEFTGCDFYGQRVPSWIGNLTKLTSLGMGGCNFSGPIPSTIGNLTQLEGLQFTMSNISGKIPESLFALPALQVVLFNGMKLSGSLPEIPDPLSSPLRMIQLNDNQLTGPIPKSFFQLRNIQYLNLESNKFTGTVELSSIWRLKALTLLSLSNNMISLIAEREDGMQQSSGIIFIQPVPSYDVQHSD
ncbi:hypothetical protein EJB05_31348, partial [Eragrostis curvula]